jgi:hypothetical protein
LTPTRTGRRNQTLDHQGTEGWVRQHHRRRQRIDHADTQRIRARRRVRRQYGHCGPPRPGDEADWDRVIDVNVRAYVRAAKALCARLARPRPRILRRCRFGRRTAHRSTRRTTRAGMRSPGRSVSAWADSRRCGQTPTAVGRYRRAGTASPSGLRLQGDPTGKSPVMTVTCHRASGTAHAMSPTVRTPVRSSNSAGLRSPRVLGPARPSPKPPRRHRYVGDRVQYDSESDVD